MMVGPACSSPTKFTPTYGRAGPLALLLEDQLLHRRRAAPAALGRPVHAGVARLEQEALPAQVVGPPAPASRPGAAVRPTPGSVAASQVRSSSRKACSGAV